MEEVGKRLKELRIKKGMSQEELEKEFSKKFNDKFSQYSISKWENGARSINRKNLSYYAQYFNVTMDWIINGDVPETKQNNCSIDKVPNEDFYLIEHNGKVIKFYIDVLNEEEKEELKKNKVLAFNNEIDSKSVELLRDVMTEIFLKSKL